MRWTEAVLGIVVAGALIWRAIAALRRGRLSMELERALREVPGPEDTAFWDEVLYHIRRAHYEHEAEWTRDASGIWHDADEGDHSPCA